MPFNYSLRRYRWRSFLNIVGPLALLGFYGFIGFQYLAHPTKNDVIPYRVRDARGVYYTWFILVVLALDRARTGLANVEAAALMHPSLAPRSAMKLMWHTDSNWANPLWWLRAIHNNALWLFCRNSGSMRVRGYAMSRPGRLWWFLSSTSMILYVSLPLSGLTMELTDAFARGSRKVEILGPRPETFNNKGLLDLPDRIRGNWRSGRPTTPLGETILYAPSGTPNVSTTYYDDLATSNGRDGTIRVFAGPAVAEPVHGNAWGIESNLTCRPASGHDLKLISVSGFDDYEVQSKYQDGWKFISTNETDGFNYSPIWVNETGMNFLKTAYSLIAAAEGASHGSTPYSYPHNHDSNTLDSTTRPKSDTTVALFEIFLWQGYQSFYEDRVMNELLKNASEIVSIISTTCLRIGQSNESVSSIAGFGLRCEVQSAVGNATVDPADRTYSGFHRGIASVGTGGDHDVFPIQISAVEALGNFDPAAYDLHGFDGTAADSTWLAAHEALGIVPYPITPITSIGWEIPSFTRP